MSDGMAEPVIGGQPARWCPHVCPGCPADRQQWQHAIADDGRRCIEPYRARCLEHYQRRVMVAA